MTEELQLANQLTSLGCAVGRSKSGRLLRVDNRECQTSLESGLLQQVLGCSAIKELYLRRLNGFLNQHISELAQLAKLKVLDVEGSDLSDQSVERLSNHESLQVLNVRDTNVSQECISRLRKVMIGVRIIA